MVTSSITKQKLQNIWLLLKITYGLLFIIAGLDKFFDMIVFWGKYISPFFENFADIGNIKILVGIIEITLGVLVLTRFTKIGAYGIAIWFLIIILNLLTMWNYLDIVVRDAVMAIGAITLARLSDIKNEII